VTYNYLNYLCDPSVKSYFFVVNYVNIIWLPPPNIIFAIIINSIFGTVIAIAINLIPGRIQLLKWKFQQRD